MGNRFSGISELMVFIIRKIGFMVLILAAGNGVALSSDDTAPMSHDELLAHRDQLQRTTIQNDLIIEQQSRVIKEKTASIDQFKKPVNPDYHNATESGSQTLDIALSVASTIATMCGPVGELIHDVRSFSFNTVIILKSAFLLPFIDCVANGFYLSQLGFNVWNGASSSTLAWNGLPSVVVMAIESTTVIYILIMVAKRRGTSAELTPLLNP